MYQNDSEKIATSKERKNRICCLARNLTQQTMTKEMVTKTERVSFRGH